MPPGTNPLRSEVVVQLARMLAIAVAYYAVARFGLSFAHYHDNATLVWPPSGLALGVLLLLGLRAWPGIFLGNMLVYLTTSDVGIGGLAGLGVCVGNTLEGVVGASLLTRVVDFRPTLERVRDVATLLSVGALAAPVISASVGVASLAWSGSLGDSDPRVVWLIWWLGNAGGAIILTPVILVAANGSPSWRQLLGNREFWAVMTLIVAVSAWSIVTGAVGPWDRVLVFAPFPIVVWAGSRLGSRGAVAASFSIMVLATFATAQDVAPFLVQDPEGRVLVLWSYGVAIGLTALTLAAAVRQRDLADQRYLEEEAARLRIERDHLLMHERARMTREMHDGLGGQLVSTIAMLESGSGTQREVIEGLRRALDDMRIAIDSLDPNTADFPTSLGKLRARLEPLTRRNGIRLHWNVPDLPDLDGFSPEESLHLLRIIQEAVTNAVRHAAASDLHLSISRADGEKDTLLIEVRDNGSGRPQSTPGGGGRGLGNMQTRADELDATLAIESGDIGTRVILRVPMRLPSPPGLP